MSNKATKKNLKNVASSMTGYGKAVYADSTVKIEVEIKSINNRNLDLVFKFPREYSEYEKKARELSVKALKRGRVEIIVNRTALIGVGSRFSFNKDLFENLFSVYSSLASKKKIKDEEFFQEAVISILSRKDIFEFKDPAEVNTGKESKILIKLIDKAIQSLISYRKKEGARLIQDLRKRFISISNSLKIIKKIAGKSYPKLKTELLNKIEKLKVTALDSSRLEQEVALLVSRTDITEEIVRLESHFYTVDECLSGIDGKKLEFILQEILREFNTIGSKASDISITNEVVFSKTQLERIREQAQNLE